MYNWVTMLYSRNWHNVVNQLYFNKIKNKNKKQKKNPRGTCCLKFTFLNFSLILCNASQEIMNLMYLLNIFSNKPLNKYMTIKTLKVVYHHKSSCILTVTDIVHLEKTLR